MTKTVALVLVFLAAVASLAMSPRNSSTAPVSLTPSMLCDDCLPPVLICGQGSTGSNPQSPEDCSNQTCASGVCSVRWDAQPDTHCQSTGLWCLRGGSSVQRDCQPIVDQGKPCTCKAAVDAWPTQGCITCGTSSETAVNRCDSGYPY